MNDSELIARAVAGDEAAFGVLVRRHQSMLRGFLRRLARGDHALADDLAQETFLEAWRKLTQFRGDGSFAGWLTRIAWSRLLMAARTRKLEALDESLPEPRGESGSDARIDLEKAMAKLSLAERAALTLCYALGYSHDEASGILDLPLGTLKSHVLRGREKLRALLEAAS
jgi:RNA polymerase sigma factor (sigma-70 family)